MSEYLPLAAVILILAWLLVSHWWFVLLVPVLVYFGYIMFLQDYQVKQAKKRKHYNVNR